MKFPLATALVAAVASVQVNAQLVPAVPTKLAPVVPPKLASFAWGLRTRGNNIDSKNVTNTEWVSGESVQVYLEAAQGEGVAASKTVSMRMKCEGAATELPLLANNGTMTIVRTNLTNIGSAGTIVVPHMQRDVACNLTIVSTMDLMQFPMANAGGRRGRTQLTSPQVERYESIRIYASADSIPSKNLNGTTADASSDASSVAASLFVPSLAAALFGLLV